MPAQQAVSTGYVELTREDAASVALDGWSHQETAAAQDAAYAHLLDEMRRGQPRMDLAVATQAVEATGLVAPSLLEVGCGSGYYGEVFQVLLNGRVRYSGVDLSSSMIELARKRYPEWSFQVGDAQKLPVEDASVDIVMNGVSLMHIPDTSAALAEARRVARSHVILHTVPLLRRRGTTYLRKEAYGHPVVEIILNEIELRRLLHAEGLEIVGEWESIPYDLVHVLGEATHTRTFLCEKAA